jgi:hypothetical protein
MIQAVEDADERMFLSLAFTTAMVDVRAGAGEDDFDYTTFVEVMKRLYEKRATLKDILDGRGEQHKWWPDE